MEGRAKPSDASRAERGVERQFRVLFAVSFIIPLLLFAAAAAYDYRREREAATQQVVATADALAEHADTVLKTNQLIIALVVDRVRGVGWAEMRADPAVHEFLLRLTRELPQLESVFLVDPQGRIAASSRGFPFFPYDVSHRDYFHAAEGQRDVYVSQPFRGQATGALAFTVSRPIDPAQGIAGGIVGVTISPGYFDRFYRSVMSAADLSIAAVIRNDGAILIRSPPVGPGESLTLVPDGQISEVIASGKVQGTYRGRSRRNGHDRVGAFRRLNDFPVVVVYSEEEKSTLAEYDRHIAVLAAFALMTAAVLVHSTRAALHRSRAARQTLTLLLDETQRREQAEEALGRVQKIEALGRLTGGVAHDFNNLLTAVIGSLELAMRRVEEPRTVQLLQGAMSAARRGARLTAQMLAFSRQQSVRLESVSVNRALLGTQDILERTLGADIHVQYALGEDVWPALADLTQLDMAVLNLAINARDAMPQGGVLRLQTANVAAGDPRPADAPPGELVMLAVTDTGVGMTDDVRARAIEPFFTTKEVGRGTGLGLSMVHGFARKSGGALDIQSVPREGTTVRIFLPRGPDAADAGKDDAPTRAAATKVVVLLVDDDEQVRISTREMLEELGHSVVAADGGPEALRLAATVPAPELLLVDYAMPTMNGGAVVEALRGERPDLPVVFITGYADAEALRAWAARGVLTLPKPFTLDELAAAIEEAVSTRAKGAPARVTAG